MYVISMVQYGVWEVIPERLLMMMMMMMMMMMVVVMMMMNS